MPGLEATQGHCTSSHLCSTLIAAPIDKLESLIVQQQNQIHQISSNQVASRPSPQEIVTYRSPSILHHTPHVSRAETALFLQKPTPTFPSQNAIHNQFGAGVTDGRPTPSVTGNGYNGQHEDMQQNMGGIHRDSFSAYNDQFAPSISRSLGQADADFPPYDLLYGLVDLFFKHIYPVRSSKHHVGVTHRMQRD
jgi:hypothetical protein